MKITLPPVINTKPLPIGDSGWRTNAKSRPSSLYAQLFAKISHNVYIRCRLAEAQNWRCCWCGCHTTPLRDAANSATTEHIIPRSLGGSDDSENLAMSCNRCNNARGNASVEDFINKKPRQCNTAEEGITRKEIRDAANHRRHMKRGEIFEKNGWKTSTGEPYSFEQWVATLRGLNGKYRAELYNRFAKTEEFA